MSYLKSLITQGVLSGMLIGAGAAFPMMKQWSSSFFTSGVTTATYTWLFCVFTCSGTRPYSLSPYWCPDNTYHLHWISSADWIRNMPLLAQDPRFVCIGAFCLSFALAIGALVFLILRREQLRVPERRTAMAAVATLAGLVALPVAAGVVSWFYFIYMHQADFIMASIPGVTSNDITIDLGIILPLIGSAVGYLSLGTVVLQGLLPNMLTDPVQQDVEEAQEKNKEAMSAALSSAASGARIAGGQQVQPTTATVVRNPLAAVIPGDEPVHYAPGQQSYAAVPSAYNSGMPVSPPGGGGEGLELAPMVTSPVADVTVQLHPQVQAQSGLSSSVGSSTRHMRVQAHLIPPPGQLVPASASTGPMPPHVALTQLQPATGALQAYPLTATGTMAGAPSNGTAPLQLPPNAYYLELRRRVMATTGRTRLWQGDKDTAEDKAHFKTVFTPRVQCLFYLALFLEWVWKQAKGLIPLPVELDHVPIAGMIEALFCWRATIAYYQARRSADSVLVDGQRLILDIPFSEWAAAYHKRMFARLVTLGFSETAGCCLSRVGGIRQFLVLHRSGPVWNAWLDSRLCFEADVVMRRQQRFAAAAGPFGRSAWVATLPQREFVFFRAFASARKGMWAFALLNILTVFTSVPMHVYISWREALRSMRLGPYTFDMHMARVPGCRWWSAVMFGWIPKVFCCNREYTADAVMMQCTLVFWPTELPKPQQGMPPATADGTTSLFSGDSSTLTQADARATFSPADHAVSGHVSKAVDGVAPGLPLPMGQEDAFQVASPLWGERSQAVQAVHGLAPAASSLRDALPPLSDLDFDSLFQLW